MDNYDQEAVCRWGDTAAYREYAQKTQGYTERDRQQLGEGLNTVFARFAACRSSGCAPDSPEAAVLVKSLQEYITQHYYTCTDEILAGLGQMYVCDERFKTNIDRHGAGTAEFVAEAIKDYCVK